MLLETTMVCFRFVTKTMMVIIIPMMMIIIAMMMIIISMMMMP